MKKFFSFVIKQSVAVVLAVVFIFGFGIFATVNMPINLLPDIAIPMVCVQVIYPGANAQSVEDDVTGKLEEGLTSVRGVTSVESYSYDNVAAIILSFDYGTDTSEKKREIEDKYSSLSSGLPDGLIHEVYDIDLNAEALAVLSVTSEKSTAEDGQVRQSENLAFAYEAAKLLESNLQSVNGVESVEIKGGADMFYHVQPFAGLELVAPLLVQAYSYGALDLPLGNVTGVNGSVQIRNNSDISKFEDIENTPVSLPSSLVSLFSAAKSVMQWYENSTAEELADLDNDLKNGVIQTLSELDGMTSEQLDKFAELKTYMNISSSYTAQDLKDFKSRRYYNEIYERVTNPPAEDGGERTPKTDEELEKLTDDLKAQYPTLGEYITVDLLKLVRDDKINTVISFREWLEAQEGYLAASENNEYYELTNSDYFVLETQYAKVYEEEFNYADGGLTAEQTEELYYRIDFVKKTSAAGLAQIADKKREQEDLNQTYSPTNAECALLFTGTELFAEHPVVSSPVFMAFVRSEHYTDNMAFLIERRGELADEITAEQFYGIYTKINLEGIIDINLSVELINFILEADLADLSTDANGNSVLVVRAKEIASVKEQFDYSSYVYFANDGTPSVIKGTVIEIYKSNGANASAVVEEVKRVYSEFVGGEAAKELGVKQVYLLDDQSQFISESIINVLVSMLIGGVLAVLIIFLFLKKVKPSLIIAVTMPLSVLAALICLYLMGITLNMVSLGGLAVGIGMLVDNSIVVIESISKHRDMDKTAFEAAVDGTAEVGGALFGSTLTTVCVFIPIIFSGGLTGEIFTDLSWAVIFSLTFSLIVAVTVIPALYAMLEGKKRMLKGGRLSSAKFEGEENAKTNECNTVQPEAVEKIETLPAGNAETDEKSANGKKKEKKPKNSFKLPNVMEKITGAYGKVLPAVLNKKLITIITAVVIFGASIGLLFLTGSEFLPSIDKGQIEITMNNYPVGYSLEEVERDVFGFAEILRDGNGEIDGIENIDYISVSVGKNGLLALTDTGMITVQLKTNRNTARVVENIREIAKKVTPAGSVTVREIDGVVASLMSGADDMSVTVMGTDGETLNKIAEEIGVRLKEAGFTDVKNSSVDKSTQYTLVFDKYEMAKRGLDYQTAILTMRIGIASYTACTVTIDGETYNLDVSFADGAIADKTSLENFIVGYESSSGEVTAIKLKDILIPDEKGEVVREEYPEACIRRVNGNRMVSVSATLAGVDTGTASKQMQNIAADVLKNYEGYGFENSGISSYLDDAFQGLAVALVISFFLLYAVMAVQFGSAVTPLIIMASIPFSFTGGFLALVITGTSLNVVSFIGLIMLMGVVVNNAIVMLEKIKQLHEEGMPHYEAVQTACKVRLRPILMTTLTTILALIPLAIGVGQGSELMQPLGIVVIGGLLIGTLVTLVIVPSVYCAIKGISAKNPDGRKKKAE